MTESTWPNEYDRNLVNMTDFTTTTNIIYWTWPKNLYFWSCSMVDVCHCKFFRHVQLLRLVIVNFFWSNLNQNLVIFIQSCELASFFLILQFICVQFLFQLSNRFKSRVAKGHLVTNSIYLKDYKQIRYNYLKQVWLYL